MMLGCAERAVKKSNCSTVVDDEDQQIDDDLGEAGDDDSGDY